MWVGELLQPISAAMGQELLSGSYIQADETTVGVQMHDGRGKTHQAYLWQYSRRGGAVVFDFRMGREREGPKRFLENFEGILQSDVETCRRLSLPVRDYLGSVFPGLADFLIKRVAELTPSIWALRN
jgi:hypothetical protein